MMSSSILARRHHLATICSSRTRSKLCRDLFMWSTGSRDLSSSPYRKIEDISPQENKWLPLNPSTLYEATNETLEAGSDLEADHPGFHDPAYRERRDTLAKFAREHKSCDTPIDVLDYKDEEITCWRSIWTEMEPLWEKYACKEFLDGLELLKNHCNYSKDNIPQQQPISDFLRSETNFVIKPVPGQLSSRTFLNGLAFRTFFCTPYVRHHSMPLYTPEPDVCHELLGHVPMLTSPEFCDFSQEIGIASLGASDEDILKLARCYWFSVEFGLCKEDSEVKAYGAGLLSSFGELQHAVGAEETSAKVELEPWDPYKASVTEHPLTTFQPLYFVADSLENAKITLMDFCVEMKSKSQIETKYDESTRTLYSNSFISFSSDHQSRGAANIAGSKGSSYLDAPCDKLIWDAWMSQWHLPSITVALELDLFDILEKSSSKGMGLSSSQLANELSVPSDRGLKALLETLAAQRYLEKKKLSSSETVYECTPLCKKFLVKTNPDFYWGNMLTGGDGSAERHRQLMDTIQDDGIIGAAEEWESGNLTPERAEELTREFHSHSLPAAIGAAKAHPLTNTKHLLDVGGGSGCYSTAFVRENEHLHATVMDLPQVCQVANAKYFKGELAEIKERLHTLSLDMFHEKWPAPTNGYDAIFFSNILHDWSMEKCKELLKKSFDTLPSGGQLLIHEILLDSDEVTPACFSIHMAVYTRGQQFFYDELKRLIEEANFVGVTRTSGHGYYSIVSAQKP